MRASWAMSIDDAVYFLDIMHTGLDHITVMTKVITIRRGTRQSDTELQGMKFGCAILYLCHSLQQALCRRSSNMY